MANSDIKNGLDSIIQAVTTVFNMQSDTLRYDKTYRAKVTEVLTNNQYRILILGKEYTLTSSSTLNLNQIIRVKAPLNNFSDIYIEGEGGGGGGTLNYNLLSNKPVLNTANTNSLEALSETIERTINLHKISKTGSYNDLLDLPTIPTKTSELSNDSGYITNSVDNLVNYTLTSALAIVATTGSYNDLLNKPIIPTSVGELTNDRFVRYDISTQGLTDIEKSNARTNIGAGTSSFSGSYNDLTSKPIINSNNSATLTPMDSETVSGIISLHKISKTGSYNDLLNKPTIPTVPSFETDTANIKMDGTVSVGTSSNIPRADHVHPTDTTRTQAIGNSTNINYSSVSSCNTDLTTSMTPGEYYYEGTGRYRELKQSSVIELTGEISYVQLETIVFDFETTNATALQVAYGNNLWYRIPISDSVWGNWSKCSNLNKSDIGLGNVNNVEQIPLSSKGVANGVATLDSNSLIPSSEIPIASATTLGGIKVGTNLSIDSSGILSATGGGTSDYTNLTNKPILNTDNNVALTVNSTETINGTISLHKVSKTGSYTDLLNLPTIPTKTSELTNDSGYITNTVNNLTNYTLSSNLATVATSGSYNDLLNKPTIPTVPSFETDTTNIKMDGTVSVGTSLNIPRADHVHPTDTTRTQAIGNSTNINYSSVSSCNNDITASMNPDDYYYEGTGRYRELKLSASIGLTGEKTYVQLETIVYNYNNGQNASAMQIAYGKNIWYRLPSGFSWTSWICISAQTYSTTETLTNEVWTNGKAIYKKVFKGTKVSGNTLTFNLGSNVSEVIDVYATLKGIGKKYVLPWYENADVNARIEIYDNTTDNNIYINSGTSGFCNGSVIAVVKYTK